MEKYVLQLLADIAEATRNVPVPWVEKDAYEIEEWKSEEEDQLTAPRRTIEDWTGIKKIQLPPANRLTPDQLHRLLEALKKMLDAYNCLVVFQITVPEDYQYRVIRAQFHQESSMLQWHMNFFEFCESDQDHDSCILGEYCHCALFSKLFSGFEDDDDDYPEDPAYDGNDDYLFGRHDPYRDRYHHDSEWEEEEEDEEDWFFDEDEED